MRFFWSLRGLLAAGGGIISSASCERIRRTTSLASGFPGTIGTLPEPVLARAASRRSSRSFACRATSSGPWHLKQCSLRIGRTSRVKSGGCGPLAAATVAAARAMKSATGTAFTIVPYSRPKGSIRLPSNVASTFFYSTTFCGRGEHQRERAVQRKLNTNAQRPWACARRLTSSGVTSSTWVAIHH